jgi:3-oxoacyl-[acyl-carrier protein] reductase
MLTQRLEGKVAIVTGGGWNIGRAVTQRFAAEGARVVIVGRKQERLQDTCALVEAAGGEILAEQGDVTSLADMERVVKNARARFGPIDVLAAIAGGGGGYEAVDAIDPEWWEHVIRINLVGTFHAVRAVLPEMRARKSGALITCTGGGAWFPLVDVQATAYATAKAGICRFTDQLAVELWDTGIRINCLQPGQTWSPEKLREVEAEEERTGTPHPSRATNHPPEDAAELAAFLASDESAPLTGRCLSVDEDWWRDRAKLLAAHQSPHAYCLRRQEA